MTQLSMARKVWQHMDCGSVRWGHVIVDSSFYLRIIGCWVYVLPEMGMCWNDVGSGGSGVGNVIFMRLWWWD